MTLLLKFWREFLILALIALVYIMGKSRLPSNPCEPEVKIVEKVVYKDKIVYKDRVVYRDRVITKPDGTRIEESTRTEEKTTKDERTKEESKEILIVTKPSKHVNLGIDLLSKLREDHYKLLLGGALRLGNTPLFLTINPSINLTNPRLENLFIGITWEIK